MSYKTKIKLEQILFWTLFVLDYMAIGICAGFFMAKYEDKLGRDLEITEIILMFLGVMVVVWVGYILNIFLHEVGHMIFGLVSGYRFNSIRFGKLMLVKKEGKIRFSMYQLPGTGGQCIMSPPDTDIDHMPVALYNLGGLIVNMILFLVGLVLFFALSPVNMIAGMSWLIFALIALSVLITNGMPFAQLGTDGANTMILLRDRNARAAFRNQMETVRLLAENYSVTEMPESLFYFDTAIPMDNPLVTAQAVSYYNYLSAIKKHDEAEKMAQFILEHAKSINQVHEKILYGELIYMAAVVRQDPEQAKELYRQHEIKIKSIAGFISIQRILYAYYTLVEPNEKKAARYAAMFEKSIKRYPYPKDAEMEREQFNLVQQVRQQKEMHM